MKVTIEMDNGITAMVEIDEMLLDHTAVTPYTYVADQLRAAVRLCLDNRHFTPPSKGGVELPFGGRGEGQHER